jgi:trehalose 6-phosphate synthase
MPRPFRFLAVLLTGLGLLALAGYFVLASTTQRWFDKDLLLRTQLAVSSAQRGLVAAWHGEAAKLTSALEDITRDERIMGAAACSMNGELLAATLSYPKELPCKTVLERMQRDGGSGDPTWSVNLELPAGPVNLSVTTVSADADPLGSVLLVHDLSFVERREKTTRNLLLFAFFVLAVGAALITLLAVRVAWKGWTRQLRSALAGKAPGEFQPLVRDVRALAERLADERAQDARTGMWDSGRLRAALKQHLSGERVVILANREPYIHEQTNEGVRVLHPASGLVTALEPVMRACSGVWVAHGSGSADRETTDTNDHILVPPGEESYLLRRVWLSEAEENGYYYGFSNEGSGRSATSPTPARRSAPRTGSTTSE